MAAKKKKTGKPGKTTKAKLAADDPLHGLDFELEEGENSGMDFSSDGNFGSEFSLELGLGDDLEIDLDDSADLDMPASFQADINKPESTDATLIEDVTEENQEHTEPVRISDADLDDTWQEELGILPTDMAEEPEEPALPPLQGEDLDDFLGDLDLPELPADKEPVLLAETP